jgi:hypothetical protein
VVSPAHPHILSHNPVFPPYLLPHVWKERVIERVKRKRKRKRKREKRKGKGITRIQGVLLLLPSHATP